MMLGIRAIHNKRSYCLPAYYFAEPKLKEHVEFVLTSFIERHKPLYSK